MPSRFRAEHPVQRGVRIARVTVLLFVALAPRAAAAQRVEIVPGVGLAWGSGPQLSSEAESAGYAGLRIQIVRERWGLYGGAHEWLFSAACATSSPCRARRKTELSVGVTKLPADNVGAHGYFSVGAGVLRWEGTDLFLEAEGGTRVPLGWSTGLQIGVHGMVTPRIPIRHFQDLWYLDLSIGLWVAVGPK